MAAAGAAVELPRDLRRKVDSFYTKLMRRQDSSTVKTAQQVIELLRSVVGSPCWRVTSELLELVRSIGRDLAAADPLQLSIGNVVRRVLFIIREEYITASKEEGRPAADSAPQAQADSNLSLANLLVEKRSGKVDFTSEYNVKSAIIEAISELLLELEVLYKNVAEQAIDHIHADETIMTVGQSRLVAEFLGEAASKKRTFEVFVAEGAPSCPGYDMANELAEKGIKVTVINDCAVFALMARMNKVIIGTHAVMANGGLITYAGTHAVALAAKHHAVPVVVVAGLHKLCPSYPFDQDTFNELGSPGAGGSLPLGAAFHGKVAAVNPRFDYVPADLIALTITNFGAHNPSYVYRLLAEYYHPDDHSLE